MHLLLHTALVETEGSEPHAQANTGSTDQAESDLFFGVIEGNATESSAPVLEWGKVESDSSGTRSNAASTGVLSELVARYAEAEAEAEGETNMRDPSADGGFHPQELGQSTPDKQSDDASGIDQKAMDDAKFRLLPLTTHAPLEAVGRLDGSKATTSITEEPPVRTDQPVGFQRTSLMGLDNSRQSEFPEAHKLLQSSTEQNVKEPRSSATPGGKAVVASQLVSAGFALMGTEEASERNVLNSRTSGEVPSFNHSNSETIRSSAYVVPTSSPVNGDTGAPVDEGVQGTARIGTLPVSEVAFAHLKRPTPTSFPGSQLVEQHDISKRAKRTALSKFFSEASQSEQDREGIRYPVELSQRVQTAISLLNATAGFSEQNGAFPVSQGLMQHDHVISREAVHEGLPLSALTTSAAEETSTSLSTMRAQPEPVNARSIVAQVLQSITRVPGESSIELRLQPEELGRVRLTLLPVDGGVSVQISAERSETLELLRRNVEMLESELRKNGFSDASFSFGSDLPQEKSASGEWLAEEVAEEAPSKIKVELASTPVVDGSGRLDIRV